MTKRIITLAIWILTCTQVQAQVFIPFAFFSCNNYYPSMAMVGRSLYGSAGMTSWPSATLANNAICPNTGGNGGTDDGYCPITLPFNFTIDTVSTRSWFMASNTYLTALVGSTAYASLGAGTPAFEKFHLGAADNSWQQVYTRSGLNYYRIRYQGKASTNGSGTDIIYEFTFYKPYGLNLYAEVTFGTHGRTSGQFGVANKTSWLPSSSGTITANKTYVFASTNGGATWTANIDSSVVGPCTNY